MRVMIHETSVNLPIVSRALLSRDRSLDTNLFQQQVWVLDKLFDAL
jgi:hypothetical protein